MTTTRYGIDPDVNELGPMIFDSDTGEYVAIVLTDVTGSDTDALARLIASAPDLLAERDALRSERDALLAALSDVMPWMAKGIMDGSFESAVLPGVALRAYDAARHAIAKAKGDA